MGFLSGNKTEAEKIEEERVKILNEGQVLVDLAVGTHGADEVVAGAMMGETGKYLAMAKYGKTKWQPTYILIFNEGIQIYYTGAQFFYNEIKSIEETNKGWLDMEFIIHTTNGTVLLKLFGPKLEALKLIILDLKEKYLEQLKQEKINLQQKEHEKSEEKIDRLIQLGKIHENGLLSDEEFTSMKDEILNGNEDNHHNNENTVKVCENCGEEILDDANFCTNCGNKLR